MTAALPGVCQVGTQFDGLGHVGVQVGDDEIFYNGNKLADFGDAYGLKRCGIVQVPRRACWLIPARSVPASELLEYQPSEQNQHD